MTRPVVIRGIPYPSTYAAAEAHDVPQSAIVLARQRGTLDFVGLGRRYPLKRPLSVNDEITLLSIVDTAEYLDVSSLALTKRVWKAMRSGRSGFDLNGQRITIHKTPLERLREAMTEFLHFFPGAGFRPAVWLNDYIGPRLDCPRPVPTADADVPYQAKYDLDPYAPLPPAQHGYGTVIWPAGNTPVAPITPGLPTTPGVTIHPSNPGLPFIPWVPGNPGMCCVIDRPTHPEPPQPAPVPIPASAGLLFGAIAVMLLMKWMMK